MRRLARKLQQVSDDEDAVLIEQQTTSDVSDVEMGSSEGQLTDCEDLDPDQDGQDLDDEDEEDDDDDEVANEWADQLLSAQSGSKNSSPDDQNVPGEQAKHKKDEEGNDNEEEGDDDKEVVKAALQRPMDLSEVQSILSSENVEVIAQGLTRFNFRLKRLARCVVDHEVSEESDLLRAYYKSSPDAIEVLNLWYFQQKHEIQRLDIPIMETLSLIVTCSRLLGSRNVGTSVAKTIIRGHMKQLYRNLSSKKHALMQVTMRLLSAMVVQGSSCARELFVGFNFTLKALPFLFKVKKPSDKGKMEDVRGLYIRFLLGFLMYGDANVKKGILETKDTVSSIFKGAHEDHYLVNVMKIRFLFEIFVLIAASQTIDFIFSVVKKKVIDDTSLARSIKQAFFNNYVLEQITKLLTRDDASVEGNASEPDEEGNLKTVADITQDFLIHLCTRPGHGICIPEPGWLQVKKIVGGIEGTGPVTARYLKHRNAHLLKWISYLRPTEVESEMSILLEVLKNCPELVAPFWDQVSLSFEGRLSSKWIANMALAANIITLPIPSILASAKGHTDAFTILAPPSLHTLVENILPSPLTRLAMGRALQHSSQTVKHVTSFVLGRALEKFGLVLQELERVRLHVAATANNASSIDGINVEEVLLGGIAEKAVGQEWADLKDALMEEIRKRVPEVQTVLSLHMKAAEAAAALGSSSSARPQKNGGNKSVKNQDDAEIEVLGLSVAESAAAPEMEEDATITPIVLQCASMKLVREYQTYFPDQMAESRFDYGKLVPADIPSSVPEIQKGVLEFLLEVPNFKWWLNPAGCQHSHLQTLLKMVCYSTDVELKELAVRVVTHFLATSYIFRNNLDEIPIWLRAVGFFMKIVDGKSGGPSVISWFDAACCAAVKNPPKFIDRMFKLVDSVSRALDPLTQSIVSHIYENRNMASISQNTKWFGKGCQDEENDAAFRNVFPFSPVVASALDGLGSLLKSLQKDGVASGEKSRQILNIARCFCFVGMDVLAYTQGTAKFLSELVKEGYAWIFLTTPLDLRNVSFKADEPASYLVLLAAGLEGVVPSKSAVRLVDIVDGCDCSAVVSSLLASDGAIQKTAMFQLTALAASNESFKAVLHIVSRLIPVLGGAALPKPFSSAENTLPSASQLPNILGSMNSKDVIADARLKVDSDPLANVASMRVNTAFCILAWATSVSASASQPVIEVVFRLLSSLLAAVQSANDSDQWGRLRHFVFRHPVLLNAFLKPKNAFSKATLSLINRFLPIDYSTNTSSIYDEYIRQVRDTLLLELSELSKYQMSDSVVYAFDAVRSFMPESDLNQILEAVLVIPVINNSAQLAIQNRLISCILTVDTSSKIAVQQQHRQITSQAFKRLLKLLQDCPSQELDEIFESSVLASVSPESLKQGRLAFRISAPLGLSSGATSRTRIFAYVPSLIDLDTLSNLLKHHPTPSRLNALKHLVASSPVLRGYALKEVGGLEGSVAEAILEGSLLALVGVSGAWAGTATALEKSQVGKFKNAVDGFLTRMQDRILNGGREQDLPNQTEGAVVKKIVALKLAGPKFGEFYRELVDNILGLSEFSNVKGSLVWLNEYFDALVLAEKGMIGQDQTVLSVFVKVIQGYLQSRKRVEIPVSSGDSEWKFETVAAHVMTKLEQLFVSKLSVASGFSSNVGLHILRDLYKSGLKYRMNDPRVLKFLSALSDVVYVKQETYPIQLEHLLQMISGHSQFKTILRPIPVTSSTSSTAVKKQYTLHPCKAALIRLVKSLLQHANNTIVTETRSTIIPAISISYLGSQNEADREILTLWHFYETKHGFSIATNAVHWGQVVSLEDGDAFSHITQSSGATGTVSPAAAAESLNLIDPILMIQSIQGFSTTIDLSGSDVVYKSLDQGLYDPSFFLPLIATAVKMGGERLDTKLLAETNALGLAVMALSSESEDVRKAAYFILDMAYAHLYKVERLQQKLQLTLLLTMLKNGITERTDSVFPQVPAIIALFFSHAMSIVSKPEHYMYPLVNSFLLSRPLVDFEDVPMFYVLFNSATDNCRRERVWLYRLLCGGIRCAEDYRVYKRRHVFDLVMSFFHFPLADTNIRKLTFEFLFNASCIPTVLYDLVTERGLLTFLSTVTTNLNLHPQNELALALPRLLTQIAKSWFEACSNTTTGISSTNDATATPHRKNNAWSSALYTCALTLLQSIQQGFTIFSTSSKLRDVSPDAAFSTYFWWLTLLQDTLHCVQTVSQGCAETNCDVTPALGVWELSFLISWIEEVEAQCRMYLSRDSTIVSEEKHVNDLSVDTLYLLPATKSVKQTFLNIHIAFFSIVTSTSVSCPPINLGSETWALFVGKAASVLKWACTWYLHGNNQHLSHLVLNWVSQFVYSGLLFKIVDLRPQESLELSLVVTVLLRVVDLRGGGKKSDGLRKRAIELLSVTSTHFVGSIEDKKQRTRNESLKEKFQQFIAGVSMQEEENVPQIVLDVLVTILKLVWGGNVDDETDLMRDVSLDRLNVVVDEIEEKSVWKQRLEALVLEIGGNTKSDNSPQPTKKCRR
ncbi:UNVERIFIED_CONTAM: nucleolar pre-ribosomal-associated protein 1 [Siphonaria sp. JEL0065]|nr:nucleolar pre-ribosomal-associated protein 1 [Siphonaria sp. JEL0065]